MTQAAPPRQRTEDLERASLSTWATLAAETKGRDRFEEPDRLRTAFQQDRDRITHALAFRLLKDKTHAFLADTARRRTRLGHTLQVAQVARTIGRALRLNEDLVEAIALAHDLGHTPFGPAGEEALALFDGFQHPVQSVRVVERLERGGRGLNLTWEVRDGILHHGWMAGPSTIPEAQVVRIANRIAVLCHHLDDALSAGVVRGAEVPAHILATLGETHGARIAALVEDVVAASLDRPDVEASHRMVAAMDALEDFLTIRVHGRTEVRFESERAIHCLRSLVVFHLENPDRLPPAHHGEDPLVTRVKDFVSALTDREVHELFQRLFTPRAGR